MSDPVAPAEIEQRLREALPADTPAALRELIARALQAARETQDE